MISQQIISRGLNEPRLLAALRAFPREWFVAAELRDEAYLDRPAPIGYGQTISQPYMVALMTQRLDVRPTDRVLEIGAGCGYQTAILAALAKDVYAIERIEPILESAQLRLTKLGLSNIHFRHGDGTRGWPDAAPFDRVLIAAAARFMPKRLLLDQLVEGGQAVLPVGPPQEQTLIHVRKNGSRLAETEICHCRFVDLVGSVE
jgi:protein-L-isoaspartate(D-aspartate) O-methyltransferase